MRTSKPDLSAVVAYSGTRMECQDDRVLSLFPPVPGEYHCKVHVAGMWLRLDEFGSKNLEIC